MPGLTLPSGDFVQRGRVLGRFASEGQGFSTTSNTSCRHSVHVQVAFHLASFLREEHRKEEAGPEQLAQPSQQSRTRTGPKRPDGAAVLRKESSPNLHVAIFDLGQATKQVLLLRVWLA